MQAPTARAALRVEERLARGGVAVELLRVPAALFGAVAALRGACYDRGWLPSVRVDAPVISVGNLTAGGSGKTPMVAWLAKRFEARGARVGLLSRGYGAAKGELNDEARMLAELLPSAQHVQDRDRVQGALELVKRGVDAIVLDDGFQHRRLARDLDLVLVDATRPWGLPGRRAENAPLLPRGLLRERPHALSRAHAVVLTRVDQAASADLVALRAELARCAPHAPLACAVHRPSQLRSLRGEARELASLRGLALDCVSALGSPAAFERTLEDLGAELGERRRFPDHHRYGARDLEGLGAGGRAVVTSAKDAAKLRSLELRHDVWVLDVELELVEGAARIEALLDALPPSRSARERAALHEGLHG
jgi:tetraacyldisaccharide 4'-kinase